ncbi:MAG: molybdopterin molybdotransferase MoeA [Bosea sp.]|uniref:molybdopterin molybdotransferase MoeA n=1 Tax=Bosea sp. (in: a-proteobacteria) TaxID=1871050 RepID=UPI002398E18B|nr:molybdopterin molybdotransferase MoeA [Bosea sp. (in: a-proteobacteria)]MCP4736857.1 molybdopterin molybdotransferase MoeA [Bosea sp. (in: a-proteobacteria)]
MTAPVAAEALLAASAPDHASVTLSVPEACARASAYAPPLIGTDIVTVAQGTGRTLAEPVVALVATPPFTQSAMDGYAVAACGGLAVGNRVQVVGRIPAGGRGGKIAPGQAIRLFTGAPIPEGADAVVMQEHVDRDGDIIVLRRPIRTGDNIRINGEDVQPLEILLQAGERLDARHLALAAAQGIGTLKVRTRPRVAVISTGDELRQAGDALESSAIYDSNRPMLLALIEQSGLVSIDGGWVPDQPEMIADRLLCMAERADLIVTSGGASLGEEDHALEALERAGGSGETLKIALKPGKPAVVGRVGSAAYLGLPGNPVSSLVCWLLLGRTMACSLEGREPPRRLGFPLPSKSAFARRAGRTEFVPVKLEEGHDGLGVEILGRGGSARLQPLAEADGLAEIAAESDGIRPGDLVLFHPLRGGFAI